MKYCLQAVKTESLTFEHIACSISSLLPKMLSMLDELTHSDDNSIIKQHIANRQHSHGPFRTDHEHMLVSAESAQWLQNVLAAVLVLQLRKLLR